MAKISRSLEDYLEMILYLSEATAFVRSVDIAKAMNVSKGAVHKAMVGLKALKLIDKEYYGEIALTELGKNSATAVKNKHAILKKFLRDFLFVSEENAELDACKMEHTVSNETLQKILEYIAREESKLEV